MLKLPNGTLLIQKISELPDIAGKIADLYNDVETNSQDRYEYGNMPYHGHTIAGFAFTWDDNPQVYYVPIDHVNPKDNLPKQQVIKWQREVLQTRNKISGAYPTWINHNVNFDAHFWSEAGAEFLGRLVDTSTQAKLLDSDRFTYGLKELAKEWLGLPMAEVDVVKKYLENLGRGKSKDGTGRKTARNFAEVPADIMGDYAGMDVISNRLLWKYICHAFDTQIKDKNEPANLSRENEILLTPVLFDIEKQGMFVDNTECMVEKAKSLKKQIMFAEQLKEAVGCEVNPRSNDDVFDMICNRFQLPILATNEDEHSNSFGNPSFDKEALAKYLVHPAVLGDPHKLKSIKLLKEFRDEAQFTSLFLNTYLDLNIDGILHPSYNQCVRTGRMSCSSPNAQQLNKRAKALIRCILGHGIISCDYSQIEFRGIVHYIQDMQAIAMYNSNPDTDFHQWVADTCKVKRKAAKCLNFGMGFGAGKKKVVSMLSADPSVIEDVSIQINELIAKGELEHENRDRMFRYKAEERSLELYNIYHERLPGIKRTSYAVSDIAKRRGYVFNLYGRRRRLDTRYCYKGFNSVVQSWAADSMKDATVKLSPRYNAQSRAYGLKLFGLVHDDTAMYCPIEMMSDPAVYRHIKKTLEDHTIKISVPVTTAMGYSFKNWAECSSDDPIYEGVGMMKKQVGGPVMKSFINSEVLV